MAVSASAFAFTLIRLPETKGRTFDDIAEEFRGAEAIPLSNKIGFNTFSWLDLNSLLMLQRQDNLKGQFIAGLVMYYKIK